MNSYEILLDILEYDQLFFFIIWHVYKNVSLVFCYIALAAILNSEKPSRLGSPQWVKISLGHLDLSKNEIKVHDPDNLSVNCGAIELGGHLELCHEERHKIVL